MTFPEKGYRARFLLVAHFLQFNGFGFFRLLKGLKSPRFFYPASYVLKYNHLFQPGTGL